MAKQVKFGKFLIIECTAAECYVAFGGPGICDNCGSPKPKGFYVAVLNSWLCEECFEEWKRNARYYPGDAPIERDNFEYYAPLLGVKPSV